MSLAKKNKAKAIHPLLSEDMNDFSPLYQSIIKNLINAKKDDIKVKACELAIESLENK